MTTIDPTVPQKIATLVSPTGEVVELFETPAYRHCRMLRYDPKKGQTASDAWAVQSVAVSAGLNVCGSHQYANRADAYHLIGRLIIEEGWAPETSLV